MNPAWHECHKPVLSHADGMHGSERADRISHHDTAFPTINTPYSTNFSPSYTSRPIGIAPEGRRPYTARPVLLGRVL